MPADWTSANKKEDAGPARLPNPRQGAYRTVLADAPFRGRGTSTASVHSRVRRLRLAVFGKAALDARASFQIVSLAAVAAQSFLRSSMSITTWPNRDVHREQPVGRYAVVILRPDHDRFNNCSAIQTNYCNPDCMVLLAITPVPGGRHK